jgi:hypothetical protein
MDEHHMQQLNPSIVKEHTQVQCEIEDTKNPTLSTFVMLLPVVTSIILILFVGVVYIAVGELPDIFSTWNISQI